MHYEQPSMIVCTPREKLREQREQIAADTEAFLARGGTIRHPEPRVLRATIVPHRKGPDSTYRVWASDVPYLSTTCRTTVEPKKRGGPDADQ